MKFIVDTTIRVGTFQTPILQDITHGQRKRSRLFHTREDESLPFHYAVRNVRKTQRIFESWTFCRKIRGTVRLLSVFSI